MVASHSNGDGQPDDTIQGRIPGSRLKLWILFGMNRRVLTGVLLGGLFVVFVVLGALDPAPLRQAVGTGDPVETLFQALVTSIVTGVTLVVTINQLVLSQELGVVADQRDRMEGAMEFRQDTETMLDSPVSPPDPASFLRALVDTIDARANALSDAIADSSDEQLRERVDDYVDRVRENAARTSARLEDAQFGTFEVLLAALDFNYSWKIYEARRLRNEHVGVLTEEMDDAFADVVEPLGLFGPAREHFKTLYFQWELINLSRAVLYAAVPALAVTVSMILYVDDPATVVGATLGIDNLVWLVSGAVTVALLPFALLIAYILRIATVAKRTLAIGPFVLRETERNGATDRE